MVAVVFDPNPKPGCTILVFWATEIERARRRRCVELFLAAVFWVRERE